MGSTEKINVLHLPFGCEDAERWEIEVPGRYDVKIEKGKIFLIKKADPKFKEGDWIVNNETGEVHQVIKCNLEDDCYLSEENIIITFASERMWHKWTILDAKAGDVLVEQDFLLIFEKFIKDNGIVYLRFDYDYYNPHFTRVGISSLDNGVNISPATKEQMKPLLGYMAEAGYVFDTEKLELQKKDLDPKNGDIYYIDFDLDFNKEVLNFYKHSDASKMNDIALAKHFYHIGLNQGRPIAATDRGIVCANINNLPCWKKSTLPNDNVTGFNSDYFCYNGYRINYKELFNKLPKEE